MTIPTTFERGADLADASVRATLRDSRGAAAGRWLLAGGILSGVAIAFLLFDAGIKVAEFKVAVESTVALGYPPETEFRIGVVELVCVLLYLFPRTAFLGALLLTAHFGGAIASQLRVGNPLVSHVLFPTYVAAMVWGGLWLREPRLRALLPLRRRAS